MEEWNIIKAYDYCYNVTDGTHDSPKQTEFGKYLITSKHIKDNRIDFESAYKISEDDYNKIITRSKVDQWDIIISMIGAYCGFCCIESSKQTDYAIKNVGLLKVGNELKCKWLYYYLTSPHGKQQLSKLRSGSSQPYISLGALRNLDIPVPNENTMSDIVSVLSSLDSKIELNRRINDNLEKSMSTLFDFYFGLDNSESNKYKGAFLTDIATFINGLAMQKFRPKEDEKGIPVLKIKELGQKSCDSSSDICSPSIKSDYIVNDGDVIFFWSGTLLVDIWSGGKCGLNQHLFKVTSSNYPLWFAYLWTRMHLNNFIRISKDKAVTMGHIKRVDLERAEISIPTDDTMQKLDKIFTPIFDSCVTIRVENRKLSQIRDSLLPKLMSGELKTDDLHR